MVDITFFYVFTEEPQTVHAFCPLVTIISYSVSGKKAFEHTLLSNNNNKNRNVTVKLRKEKEVLY